jgi:excisionase family DNA binding protein
MKTQKPPAEQEVTAKKKIPELEPLRRRVLSIKEAGVVLGISKASAYEFAASGALPTIKLGRRRLVPVAALDRLLGETT